MNILSFNFKNRFLISVFVITLSITKVSSQTKIPLPSEVVQLSSEEQKYIKKEVTVWIESLYKTYNTLIQSKDKLEKEKYINHILDNFYYKPYKTNKVYLFNDLDFVDSSDTTHKDVSSDIYLNKLSNQFDNTIITSIGIEKDIRLSDIYIQKLYRPLLSKLETEEDFRVGHDYFQIDSTYYIEAIVSRSLKTQTIQGSINNTVDVKYFISLKKVSDKWGEFRIKTSYKGTPIIRSTESLDSLYKKATTHQSFFLMKKVAKQGHVLAQTELGEMYEYGMPRIGMASDYNQAEYWFRKVAEQGYPFAQYSLGCLYSKEHSGISKNLEEATYWFRKAAEQGHYLAQSELGSMYMNGLGVLKNNKLATYWYSKAAEHGEKKAQFALGYIYKVGKGVPKDNDLWAYWMQRSAENDYDEARLILGYIYYSGDGLLKNYRKALYQYKRIALIYPVAQYHLGIMYDEGKGVPQNKREAILWYNRACINNISKACKKLKDK